jgi:predicted SprT family Zn-dependent metalloprotease
MILNPTSATYDSLLLAYKFMNEHLFANALPACLITLQRETHTFGYFCHKRFTYDKNVKQSTDEIALNPQYFRASGRDDRMVVSTLVHEMCHLWQHHFGKPGRARYHNKEWANKMRSLGLVPSNTGENGGKDTGDQMSHFIDKSGRFAKIFDKLKKKGFALEWIEYPPSIQQALATGKLDLSEVTAALTASTKSGGPSMPRKVDKSKLKYTCPKCGLNAWAKTGANLMCGDCDEAMIYEAVE